MDVLVEDDICILNYEKVYKRDIVILVLIYLGDEFVVFYFVFVIVYEDIKKWFKDLEKENFLLKKRIRFLEEKLIVWFEEEISFVGWE